MLQQLFELGVINHLDLFFADLHQPISLNEKIFLTAVMAASRSGHLCLDLDRLSLPHPSLETAWKEAVLSGVSPSPYIRQEGRLYYLEKNYVAETQILQNLRRLSCVKPLDIAPPPALNPEQQAAFKLALSHSLTIISGGPGTGKTYLTSHLVSPRTILAAPTGKAAARLKQLNPTATCGTLHSLLGIRSEKTLARGSSYLSGDLIIVDESSMIDVQLLAFFLASLQLGTRVIFLGDSHQLPPVESGSLFGDLVDLLPTAHLHECLRSDRAEILHLAEQILSGKPITPHHPLSEEFLIQQALSHYPLPSSQEETSLHESQFCILSPLREGPFGVNHLNQQIFHLLLRKMKSQDLLAIPILITRTDYNLSLFNGEMGVLWRSLDKPLYAEFPTAEGLRRIPASALPPYELGYVLSVHKSQGSEFNHVVVALPPGSEAFGREVLYTAVTRAKHSVILCGDAETIHQTLQRSNQRHSGLRQGCGKTT